jgi:CubicO group peptidase (beta-lactamase class C family)
VDNISTFPNVDLEIAEGNMSRWSRADQRRRGFHHLHQIARYGCSFRSARVLRLEKRMSLRIAELEGVRRLTALPWFSAMVVIQGQYVVFERYASDFGADAPHSIQSITKTIMNLVIGQLVEQGRLDLSRKVADYIPEIGSGYAQATLQQVLNMDVVNDYTEDFADPQASYYEHEEAMGWRLPRDPLREETEHSFLARIASADTNNRSGHVHYKDANTAVLGWIAERASERPLRSFIADIVDAAGLEGVLHITTDRTGVPTVEGGACLTARDLARYFALFVRGGRGVSGEIVGSASFIEQSLRSGVAMPAPYEGIRYSNHLMVRDRVLGHGGWGGQYALANLQTGTVAVFFSVLENEHAINREYLGPVIGMLESVASL